MGTRSLTHVKDENGVTLVTIYRQLDGNSMGANIKAALGGRTLVNGYDDKETQINGMGCAAAMLISKLKKGCGDVYIMLPDTHSVWEDYTYTVGQSPNMEITLHVYGGDKVLFDGLLAEFNSGEE